MKTATNKFNTFKDERLPKGYTIFLNYFDEFVICDDAGRVAKVDNGIENYNVRASATKEGAVQHFINKRISNGMVE